MQFREGLKAVAVLHLLLLGLTVTALSQTTNDRGTYPGCVAMPAATDRLNKDKPSSWLEARVCFTNDSIDDVIKYFKRETKTFPQIEVTNRMVKSLMHNNWEVREGTLAYPPAIFFLSEALKNSKPDVPIKTTLGVMPFSDSLMRVHLLSPRPESENSNELSAGTMLTIISERIPREGSIADDQEKAYTGRDVTRTAWIKTKPEPDHPGGPRRTVILKVILTARGEVKSIRIVGDVFDQFTRAAIDAARKIKFEPAIKDGRYVSVWFQLEYNFHP